MIITMHLSGETCSTIMVFHAVFLSFQMYFHCCSLDLFLCLHVKCVHETIDELWWHTRRIMHSVLLGLKHDTPAWLRWCLDCLFTLRVSASDNNIIGFYTVSERTQVCLETELCLQVLKLLQWALLRKSQLPDLPKNLLSWMLLKHFVCHFLFNISVNSQNPQD